MAVTPTSSEHEQLKIIGAGFGRTGTLSLRDALNILGFNCYHMENIKQNVSQEAPKWDQVLSQPDGSRDWDLIFKQDNFEAAVDFPSSLFYKDQLSYYPNAKVILTIRETPDAWYKSALNSIYAKSKYARESYFFRMAMRLTGNKFGKIGGVIWDEFFNGAEFETNPEKTKKIYSDWIEDVKKTVPKDKLLVLDLKANKGSWESLCNFLNVDIPKDNNNQVIPFPFVNKNKDKQNELSKLKKPERIFNGIVAATVIGIVGYVAYRYANANAGANANGGESKSKQN